MSKLKQNDPNQKLVRRKVYTTNALYDDLEHWQKGNPAIHGSYRRHMKPMDIVYSAFHLHNETANFWTHFLGFLMMLWLLHHALNTWLADASLLDKTLFACYALGQASQMIFSAVFHLAKCYSATVFRWTARLDYAGIAITIAFSHYQPIYYGLYCRPLWSTFYNGVMTLAASAVVMVLVQEKYHAEPYATFRAMIFLSIITFSIAPLFHSLVVLNGWPFLHPLFFDLLTMGVCYLVGVAFFVTRWPESKYPGSCDRSAHSHAIWHVCIIIAALAHYNVEYNIYHLFRPNGQLLSCDQFEQILQGNLEI